MPRDRGAGRREEGRRQAGGAKSLNPEAEHDEHAARENGDRSEIALSARSALSPTSPVVDLSCPPTPTDDAKAGARATARAQLLSWRSCRGARPHTSSGRTWGKHRADASSGGGATAVAVNLMVRHSQTTTKVELLGGHRRSLEAGRRETACASMSALGGGVLIRPLVTPAENTRAMPFSPDARQGGNAGGGRVVGVGKSSPHRRRRADAAAVASPTTSKEGGLQIQRLPTAVASRASSAPRKETAVVAAGVAPGLPRGRRQPSREASHPQSQRPAISAWEGEKAVVVKQQDRGMTGSGVDAARGRGGAQMHTTTVLSANTSVGDAISVGSANSSTSGYCGWNKTSNSQS